MNLIFDDKKNYTKRVFDCLNQINDEIILFLHEDMILYDAPDYNKINEFIDLIKNDKADFIKLLKIETNSESSQDHPNLIKISGELMFSVQPTLCKSKKIKNIFESFDCNIWDFELNVQSACINHNYLNCYMAHTNLDKKRGLYHFDSNIFPCISTAIFRGKWNMLEYKHELTKLFKEYNYTNFKRGFLTNE